MKLFLLTLMIFLAGCASRSPYRPLPNRNDTINDGISRSKFDNDVIHCERQAAVATIGSKGEAFGNCMRARGHAPGR